MHIYTTIVVVINNMTFRENKLLIYEWIKKYLKDNDKVEYLKLISLIAITHGTSKNMAKEMLQDLKFAEILEMKKEENKVIVCLIRN